MRPMRVVVRFVLAEGTERMCLVPDQDAIEQLATAGLDPPFHDRVYPGDPDAAEDHGDTRVGEDSVEQGGKICRRDRG